MENILAHNEGAAATWGSGGQDYDRISEFVSDALTHLVNRIDPRPGERFLDVATGTGWTARLLSSRGATVTGVDIGAGVIEAAKALAPDIAFQVADAEALPFEDANFDAVTSTFGVMFVAQPQIAARELARVCKKGGRLGLLTWVPEGTVTRFFQTMQPYMPPRPANPPPSPFEWGRPEHFRIAWRRVRSAVRNRDNDVADARWRISLAAFRQWLWSSQDPRRKYRSSATGAAKTRFHCISRAVSQRFGYSHAA
jgi:SAM-dependent methyltransferase